MTQETETALAPFDPAALVPVQVHQVIAGDPNPAAMWVMGADNRALAIISCMHPHYRERAEHIALALNSHAALVGACQAAHRAIARHFARSNDEQAETGTRFPLLDSWEQLAAALKAAGIPQ